MRSPVAIVKGEGRESYTDDIRKKNVYKTV